MKNRQKAGSRRRGENGVPPERRSRTFFSGDGWYFMTRERIDVGPFDTQAQAEAGVQDYINFSMDVDHLPAEPAIPIPDESETGNDAEDDDIP